MPPKIQYTKEQILSAAIELVQEGGVSKITMRKIASRLGCSVAPLYVNFKNGEELMDALLREIGKLAWEYSTKPYTEYGFYNIGIGQILFARDNPKLYLELIQMDSHCFHIDEREHQAMIDIMAQDQMINDLSREQLGDLLQKMAFMTSGISLSVVTGNQMASMEDIFKIMEDTVYQLVYAMKGGITSQKNIKIDY